MESVVAARGDTPFADLADFADRIDPRQLNRMQLENLVQAGAFDRLEANRARLFAGAETILRRAQADQQEKESGQIGLFGGVGGETRTAPPARHPRLAAAGASGVRGRGHRLPSDRASARCLRPGAAPPSASRKPLDAEDSAGSAGQARRHRHRDQGAHHPDRQPHGVGAHFRCLRLGRGHLLQRSAEPVARDCWRTAATSWSAPI